MKTRAQVSRRDLWDGAGAVLEFGAPPANILDRETMGQLREALEELASEPGLKVVGLAGAGEHFSYGASVPEHMPGEVEAMLPGFHALLRAMNELPLPPLVALVRGRCLGGGFELALACDWICAKGSAELGCPEIKLGVFPPAAAALLPLRASAGAAAGLVWTGATLSGSAAAAAGIVDQEAPAGRLFETFESWAQSRLLPLSGAGLRQARKAARWPWRDALERVLPQLERQYLDELMATEDAREGLQSFLEKRAPQWRNR